MERISLAWTPSAKAAFEKVQDRAIKAGRHTDFKQVHNEIVLSLRDPKLAFEKGEIQFKTKKASGEVRHWVHGFISVVYAVLRDEKAGWVLRYDLVPEDRF